MNVLVPVRQTEHKVIIDPDTFNQYADIGFSIMMQLFGHKVEYVKSNITKEGIEKNNKMWKKNCGGIKRKTNHGTKKANCRAKRTNRKER